MKTATSQSMKRFNHLTGEIGAVYHAASLRLGLSDSVMQILYTICDFGDSCLLSEICRLTGLPKQTVNSAIRKLERGGIVTLEAAGAKSKRVRLTGQGLAYTERTVDKIIKVENEIFDSWSKEEVNSYLLLTERYLNALTEKTEALQKSV
jgi:DNA-binding MarR family transcriptional regulator